MRKKQIPLIALFVILTLVLILVVVLGIRRSQIPADTEALSGREEEAVQEKWQEGTVSHNGR